MIKACIFDVDGTILDSMPVWAHLGSSYVKRMGKQPKEDLDQILFSMTTEESSAYIHAEYLPLLNEEEIRNGFLKLIDEAYALSVPAKPGAVSFLHCLHAMHMPLIAATTGERSQDEAAFNRLGISDCFMDILTTSFLHTDKKQPLIYLKAAEEMKSRPEETAVFEDTLIPVMTAYKSGFKVIGLRDAASASDWEKMKPYTEMMIDDFNNSEQLLTWMKGKEYENENRIDNRRQ